MATVDDYDVASDFNESRYNDVDMESNHTRSSSRMKSGDDADTYLQISERAMQSLQMLQGIPEDQWKKAISNKGGVVVHVLKKPAAANLSNNIAGKNVPVVRGKIFIPGKAPTEVFGLVGTRRLWDDWYNDGNLVENLSETTSLTYMSMKPLMGVSVRDLSLVERVAGNAQGKILFVATSVVSPLIPRVSGRVRAKVGINGWILEPSEGGTEVTYYLQATVGSMLPKFAQLKFLVTRPLQLVRIKEYLVGGSKSDDGSSGNAGINGADTSSGNSGAGAGAAAGGLGGAAVGGAAGSGLNRSRSSRSSGDNQRSSAGSGSSAAILGHVELDTSVPYASKLADAHAELYRTANEAGWSRSYLFEGQTFEYKKQSNNLPKIRTRVNIPGVTSDAVLGTILSKGAKTHWDVLLQDCTTDTLANGFDQGIISVEFRGVYSRIPRFYDIAAFSVQRKNPNSDNGELSLVVIHVDDVKLSHISEPKTTRGNINIAGYIIQPDHHNGDGVVVTQITDVTIPGAQFQGFVETTWMGVAARGLTDLQKFIDAYGTAPYFYRWADSSIMLSRADESNLSLTKGGAIFEIRKNPDASKKTSASDASRAWLQWSDRMYNRGLNVVIEPSGSAKVARVLGASTRALQFEWDSKLDKLSVTLSPAKGDGPDDVYLDNKYVDETVMTSQDSSNTTQTNAVSKKESKSGMSNGGNAALGAGIGAGAGLASSQNHSKKGSIPGSASGADGKSAASRSLDAQNSSSHPSNATQEQGFSQSSPSYGQTQVASPNSITITYQQLALVTGIFAIAFILGKLM